MRFVCWIVVCAAFAGCGGPAEAPTQPAGQAAPADVPKYRANSLAGYDVVVVVIDSLRSDFVDGETAPFLAEFAGGGLRFSDAASNSSHVLQSLASFFTGRLPTAGGTIGAFEAEPHDQTRTLAQYFAEAGYYTGLLANQPAIQGAGFTKGFEEIDIARAGQPLDDARLVQRATEFLEDAGDDRVFLYVHFAGPLASRLYFGEAAEGSVQPLNVAQFAEDYAASFPPPQDRVDATRDEYADAIRKSDAQLAKLVDAFASAGRAEKTLFVVTSLNGFEVLEHGALGSGWTVYDEATRVPLVLRAEGAVPAAAIADVVSLVDVAPTILALLGIEDDGAAREGTALFGANGDALEFAPPPGGRIAEVVIPERVIVRSVTVDGMKYVASSLWPAPEARFAAARAHQETANAFLDGSRPLPPLWGAGAHEALFDLSKDPRETSNVLASDGGRAADLRAALESYRALCTDRGIAPRLATQFEIAPDPETLQNLESLGYL